MAQPSNARAMSKTTRQPRHVLRSSANDSSCSSVVPHRSHRQGLGVMLTRIQIGTHQPPVITERPRCSRWLAVSRLTRTCALQTRQRAVACCSVMAAQRRTLPPFSTGQQSRIISAAPDRRDRVPINAPRTSSSGEPLPSSDGLGTHSESVCCLKSALLASLPRIPAAPPTR
jgi:hypothetical protein